jgi:hypothetical protein
MMRMQSNNVDSASYEELFSFSCPKVEHGEGGKGGKGGGARGSGSERELKGVPRFEGWIWEGNNVDLASYEDLFPFSCPKVQL